jgi:uncharacterized protein
VAKACPICDKPAEKAHTPFCSKRCADLDLIRWVEGKYAVPVVEEDDLPDDEEGLSQKPS